ncbi:MAG: AAA family ATPase [Candidatus Contendobacter sp.]|nr:AAA family ATPase [Candidatus Contendobacter sp.]
MRIDHLHVKNFKGFQDKEFSFHPQFNLIVGVNGTGKTSVLDALSIAVGSWFLGIRGYDTRPIRSQEVNLASFEAENIHDNDRQTVGVHWEPQYPCSVKAVGEALGNKLSWLRSLNTPGGRTTYGEATAIKNLAANADALVRSGKEIILPLISYYGTGRLWDAPREQAQVKDEKALIRKESLSRFAGYRNSVDPRLSVTELMRWIARQSWISYQQGSQLTILYEVVQKAIVGCVEGATHLYFDASFGEVIVEINRGRQPFNNLSDGQRCMLAMVGDMAQKAAILNPHLGDKALEETPGVVLIDELDLHLHPKWQRRIIADLRRTFPKIQFFTTTHAPQLVGQIKPEEIFLLDSRNEKHPGQSYGMDSNWILRHIMGSDDRDPDISIRLDALFEAIEAANFSEANKEIIALRREIGDHPDLVEAEAIIARYTRFNDEE